MFSMFKTISVVSLLALSGAAVAQEQTAEQDAAATAEPQVGETYVSETSGDWDVRCLKTEEGTDPCQIYQLLLNDAGNAVAEFTMLPLNEEGPAVAGATMVTPLETYLPAGIAMTIDGGEERRYDFTFCNVQGCVSRMGVTAEDISLMQKGAKATVKLVPAGSETGEPVVLTLSLSGFTAAYEKVVTSSAQ
ncbi:invasion associated locus B family protein [Marivivens sp. LCG002]|uniref:invasion associated locus B family protein n=1 Tax=Marivivens sp. LCG002 TaxID=3051171 RepID=UPI0025574143|nr:invasion associated locus B family protein [Marivivens sp. LCG002]WIV52176.1 invasion associated locus B family protein [Marivivens sp. LCG002]